MHAYGRVLQRMSDVDSQGASLESQKVWPDFNPLQKLIFTQGIKLSIVLGAAIHEPVAPAWATTPRCRWSTE